MSAAPTVVIPTFEARELLAETLESLAAQTVPVRVIVVDNASSDGTADMISSRFPDVRVVRSARNLGFGRAINLGVAEAAADTDAIVLVNNDAVCGPSFVEHIVAPLDDPAVGMVAGVLLQGSAPERIDSAGVELDATLGAWDVLWNEPLERLATAPPPVGPCGGAAAYRAQAFREVGGFDEAFFAYWEDVDLALRLRLAGWRCVAAASARALHRHGATLGAASPAQRRLEAFGRGYVLARYRVGRRRPLTRLKIAALDWPVLLVHLVVRREAAPLRARLAGRRRGLERPRLRAPLEVATVGFWTALGRQARLVGLRVTGGLPSHFGGRSATLDGRGTQQSDHG